MTVTLADAILMVLDTKGTWVPQNPFVSLRALFAMLKRHKVLDPDEPKRRMNQELNRLVQRHIVVRRDGGSNRHKQPQFALQRIVQEVRTTHISHEPEQSTRSPYVVI